MVKGSRCRGGIVHIRGGCSRALLVPLLCSKALWRFRVSTSNSPSGRSRLHSTRQFVILIILTLNKIFEYVKMTISAAQEAVPQSQGALTSSRKYLSHLEMTVFGSICTRSRTDRTLICNAILYHFQITLFCGRINRPSIPLTLFLLSRPLEQLEFIRFSNSPAERFVFQVQSTTTIYAPTQTPKSISTTSLSP